MDHDYIEQSDLVDQYVMGRLTTQESEQFEEHFVDCPVCIDRLKTARDFRQGLRLLSFQQTIRMESHKPRESPWAFLQMVSWKPVALAACSLLLAVFTGLIFLVSYSNRLRFEADQAKSNSLDWQHRYEEQQQSSLSAEQQRQKAEQERQKREQELREQVLQLEAQIQSEQNRHNNESGNAENSIQVEINPQVLILNSVRSSSPASNVVHLSRSSAHFWILIPLEGTAEYKTYRLIIKVGSRILLRKSGFTPDSDNSLRLGLSSKNLPAGDYLLIVEGIIGSQDFKTIGNYPFQVIK